MAEYVQVLERLRSLAMEWTEQYEEIMARSHHIEYLFSNLDKLNSASANSHLIFQQHKQIQSQLRQIYKLLGPLTRTLKALAKLHEQAHDLDEEEVVDKVQRISGITREYVKECVSHVYETSLKETRRVMMVRRCLSESQRQVIGELVDGKSLINMGDLQDRLKCFNQLHRYQQVQKESTKLHL